MFASRVMACAPKGSELHVAAMETFELRMTLRLGVMLFLAFGALAAFLTLI